ncbi:MAG: calcium/sodium antiporter [Anaerolineales bacterium]|nr:calcium/sodium antiporter [Anaerolineales bacterium]MCB0007220.1 calcium/sodium antiporter [Anaerolineales bacterium]MCB0018560.1 calcium/sodium antiporter [Anaerolineales bacterium]MCB8962351.1 calcium/sodium antiporter [Ardenticatenales bacterium]
MILDLLIIFVCIVVLWKGATFLVEAASRIARQLGMSELVIGLTVVAIGTSAPEFGVTVLAALNGRADISIGNVVGSNIFNLGFILGGLALIGGIATTRKLVYRDGVILILATLVLGLFLADLELSRLEGILMLAGLISYVGYLFFKREMPDEEEIPEGEYHWTDVPRLIGGIIMVILAGHFLVESASELARLFGLSEWVIGVTIVAFGTSAPEIATSGIALLKGKHGISAGNLIGSDLFNLLGVLGLAALIQPMALGSGAYGSILLLIGMVIGVVIMMRTGWRLSRWEGGLLVLVNVIRWGIDLSGGTLQ